MGADNFEALVSSLGHLDRGNTAPSQVGNEGRVEGPGVARVEHEGPLALLNVANAAPPETTGFSLVFDLASHPAA